MPRVRLDMADEETASGPAGTRIRIDTDVFAALSGERETTEREIPPTILRWLESWRP